MRHRLGSLVSCQCSAFSKRRRPAPFVCFWARVSSSSSMLGQSDDKLVKRCRSLCVNNPVLLKRYSRRRRCHERCACARLQSISKGSHTADRLTTTDNIMPSMVSSANGSFAVERIAVVRRTSTGRCRFLRAGRTRTGTKRNSLDTTRHARTAEADA
jgi:hypothetical protein